MKLESAQGRHVPLWRSRIAGSGVATSLLAVMCMAPVATASYGPGATPVSVVGTELGDRGSAGALLAGDGQYIVFRTSSSSLLGQPPVAEEYYSNGWVRKDTLTGAVDLVATPERRRRSDNAVVAVGVARAAAGVSDDGRYVLFDSAAALVDTVQSTITPHVYVRDMTKPRNDPSGYELVSAEDGSDEPPRYEDRRAGSSPGLSGFSLSDDGRTAVFVTQTASSLPAEAGTTTPRYQIFVRSLDTHTTRLVTRQLVDPTLPGSPVEPTDGAAAPFPALSGEGSAVAWVGSDPQQQARFLVGEAPEARQPHLLWRDLGDGPAAAARRIAGEADPEDPGCPLDSVFVRAPTAVGPCYGPFAGQDWETTSDGTPPVLLGISDDGRRVMFSSAARVRPFEGVERGTRGFVADMTAGISRKRGVGLAWSQPLTRHPITEGTFAGDGRHAAFISVDSQFDGLQPVGSFQTGELITQNVFAVDLTARSVERVTVAHDGRDYALAERTGSAASVSSVQTSDDGGVVAFTAADGNLFVGDVNGAPDVQVVRRSEEERGSTRQRELPPPPPPPVVAMPRLEPLAPVHAVIGRVRLDRRGVATVLVRVPAAGTLRAEATGRVAGRGARAGSRIPVGRDRRVLKRAARVTLRITPSRRVRRSLRSAPRRISVDLRIQFAAGTDISRSNQAYSLVGRSSARPARSRGDARRQP